MNFLPKEEESRFLEVFDVRLIFWSTDVLKRTTKELSFWSLNLAGGW